VGGGSVYIGTGTTRKGIKRPEVRKDKSKPRKGERLAVDADKKKGFVGKKVERQDGEEIQKKGPRGRKLLQLAGGGRGKKD